MIKSTLENLSEPIGFEIGNSDDVIQANLINGFCKGLANSCNERQLEMQLCSIVNRLDAKSHRVLKAMVEFINLKEKP